MPTKKHAGCDNTNLDSAKKKKNDEFYTHYEDIEKELLNYRDYFINKIIYIPCDGPVIRQRSNFWTFFVNNFDTFKIKKIISTNYNENGTAQKYIYSSSGENLEDLKGNGSFLSEECNDIINNCDIVITNPPFSIFRDFMNWINKYNKDFIIIGSQNSFSYKEIFPMFKENRIFTGYNMVRHFIQPNGSDKDFGNICWLTNLKVNKVKTFPMTKEFTPMAYPKYDNYDAIEVSRCANIPKGYHEAMGVPVTFLYNYDPNQFEILGCTAYSDNKCYGMKPLYLNKIKKFTRIIVKEK